MTQQTTTVQAEPQLSDLVDHLMQFDGPSDQFLLHLLAVQCHVGAADGGAILRSGPSQEPEILAVFPPPNDNKTTPVWLVQAVKVAPKALASTETVTAPLQMPDQMYGQAPEAFLLLIPLRGGVGGVRGAAAFVVHSRESGFVAECCQRLELTVSLLSLYEMRLALQARQADLQRLRRALEVLAAINDMDRFKATAMAFCNELATAFGAERVSLGFLKGRYVHVEGMSHTEKVVRKMELVQAIESAMEECLDQDLEVIYPMSKEATFVSRAAKELATRHGPTTVCSLPLRRAGDPQGVLAVERAQDQPYNLEELETMRFASDLCTPRLLELREHDKWVGAKVVAATRKGAAALVGPRHTWVKLIAIGVFAAVAFLTLYRADWRVDAPFAVETELHQNISAPFAGRIESVHVEVGDDVVAHETLLLVMETAQLAAALAKAQADKAEHNTAAALAEEQGNTAEEKIYQQRAKQAQAEIDLLKHNIDKAQIRSPISGKVVEGDLKGMESATIEQGKKLLSVAPVENLRAELLIPEKRIADVIDKRAEDGVAGGELAAVAFPGTYLRFVVQRISPVAEVVDQRNVFRVRVGFQLEQKPPWLRAGLQGVAKIHIGKASYAWLWTRDLIAWVRMKLWW